MFPRWHILFGLIFSILFFVLFPLTAWYNLTIIFFASFLIDFDHYATAVWKTGKWNLSKAYDYYMKLKKKAEEERRKGIFRKGDFHVFHTIEFHALILAIGLIFSPFLYVFIGMLFHSLLDLVDLSIRGELYRREFFLTNWIRRRIKERFTKS